MADMEEHTVDEAQWEEAKKLFDAGMANHPKLGLDDAKFECISNLLINWDGMTPGERRGASANAHFWHGKYMVVEGGDDDDGGRQCFIVHRPVNESDDVTSMQKLVPRSGLFDAIAEVHRKSAHYRPPPQTLARAAAAPPLPPQSAATHYNRPPHHPHHPHPQPHHSPPVPENHNKDLALFKACKDAYGSSVPRLASCLFVKCCPVCIKSVRVRKRKVAGFQPIITKGFGKRGQVMTLPRRRPAASRASHFKCVATTARSLPLSRRST